jgi:L-seryl-tRNA(Ser) seleniumtransferase
MGAADHGLVFEQNEGALAGTHVGERTGGDLRGRIEGDQVQFRSSHPWEGTRLGYEFVGRVSGESMSGEVDLGEYGKAAWSAKRHTYGQPGGLVRPLKNV